MSCDFDKIIKGAFVSYINANCLYRSEEHYRAGLHAINVKTYLLELSIKDDQMTRQKRQLSIFSARQLSASTATELPVRMDC
jgi:hypothetical protein